MDYYNGLTFNQVLVPEEVISHILSYVDAPQLLKCRYVCKKWNEIITSNSLWCLIYERKYNKSPKVLPWYLYYYLFSGFFDTNLLQNVNGEQKFKHWVIMHNGGNEFAIEKTPIGSHPLPKKVPEFKNNTSCFATSYGLCAKTQAIHFKEGKLSVLREYKPHIYVSEWVAPRFDCGCRYASALQIICEDGIRVEGGMLEYTAEQWAEPKWIKLETVITNYPDDIEYIEFAHSGQDTQFWAGHYGVKMAGATVKLLFDSISSKQSTELHRTFCNLTF